MRGMGRTLFLLFLIAGAGAAVYSSTFEAPFVFDDPTNIINNPLIRSFDYFLSSGKVQKLPADFVGPGLRLAFETRPVGFLTFALNYRLNGLDVWGYHLFNILIHIVNSVLVFGLVMVTFKTPSIRGKDGLKGHHAQAVAFLTGLFFAVHPVQTQAVTYISQRFASLAALFYLGSLLSYAGSRLSEGKKTKLLLYVASLSGAVLAIFTKEISFTLPVVLALYEFVFFEGTSRRRAALLLPFFSTMLVIPLKLVSGGLHDSMRLLAASEGVSRWDYLFTEFRVIVTYIRLLFFPVGQNLDYDYPVYHSLFQLPVLLSFLFLSGLFILSVHLLGRSNQKSDKPGLKLVSFGVLWFFITLSVESSIIPIGDLIFEHRLYLPSVGFFLAGTVILLSLVFSASVQGRVKQFRYPAFLILLVPALVLGVAAYERNNVWGTRVGLWEDTARKSPLKPRPHRNLALSYYEAGRFMDAIREGRVAAALAPEDPVVHSNLGLSYEKAGMLHEAANEFRAALKIDPSNSFYHYNLGMAYKRLGRVEEARKEFEESIALSIK